MPSYKSLTSGIPGSEEYTKDVTKLRQSLDASIPASLRLSSAILDDFQLNVTQVPYTCGLMTKAELDITELDATAVRDNIASGNLSAVDAVSAFGKRAVIGHQLIGCLTEIFLDEGLARAKELDAHYKKTGQVVGPLHGVPISVKDHMQVAGHRSSAGFLSTLVQSEEDCDLVAILRKLGAVFYVKTNQPQGIMHAESQSFYARTLNPHNVNLSAGGSSGGEGALVAFKGSCLGLGSDIGGSIRIPSAQNGIYGFKPTTYQFPMRGMLGITGWTGVVPATGPMCASVRDFELFNSLVLSEKPHIHDETLYATSWNGLGALPQGRKVKIGFMLHDDVVLPHPAILRALDLVKSKLSKLPNVELVAFSAYKHDLGWKLARDLFFPGGSESFGPYLKGEKIMPLSEWILGSVKDHTFVELIQLLAARDDYRQKYNDHYIQSGVDAIICPPWSGSSPPHDHSMYIAYTSTWNVLDYPAAIVPTGIKVDPKLDARPTDFKAMSAEDQKNFDYYDPNYQIGAPVTVQVVSRKNNDAIVIGVAKLVDDVLKGQ